MWKINNADINNSLPSGNRVHCKQCWSLSNASQPENTVFYTMQKGYVPSLKFAPGIFNYIIIVLCCYSYFNTPFL